MTGIHIRKTKTVLNKMFDTVGDRGRDGEFYASVILFNYFEYLRENGYTVKKMFGDAAAVRKTIGDWRNPDDPALPKTYEKNLLLSSIFSCEIEDIVFNGYNEGEKASNAYDFELSLTWEPDEDVADYGAVRIYLPRIRDKAEGRDKFLVNYEIDEVCSARVLRSVFADGRTLLDRAEGFIDRYGYKDSADEIVKNLKSVRFNWRNGKPPSSLESLLLFQTVTGIGINELYSPVYEEHRFEAYLPGVNRCAKRVTDRIDTPESVLNRAERYMEENGLEIYRAGRDYIVTAGGGKFGMVVFRSPYAYLLDNEYDYVLKDGERIITVKDAEIEETETRFLPMLTGARETLCGGNADINLAAEGFAAAGTVCMALTAILSNNWICREISGGKLIVERTTGKVMKAKYGGGEDGYRHLIRYENGRPKFGLEGNGVFIPPLYNEKIKAGDGIFTAKSDEGYVLLDVYGREVTGRRFEDSGAFKEGRVPVRSGGYYGYADENGDIVVDCVFDYASDFSEGLAAVTVLDKAGYVDADGNIVIKPSFDAAYRFSDGVAVIELNGKFGYVDKEGVTVLPPIYDEATSCRGGMVRVLSCGRLINKKIRAEA